MESHPDTREGLGPQARYFAQLDRGIFEIQRCTACSKHQFYPRILCQHCGLDDLQWVAPTGRGRVYATSVVRRKPQAGGDYNVSLIDLDESVRLMSRVEGLAPDQVRIGQRVRARIARAAGEMEEARAVLVFDPEEAA